MLTGILVLRWLIGYCHVFGPNAQSRIDGLFLCVAGLGSAGGRPPRVCSWPLARSPVSIHTLPHARTPLPY